MEEKKGFLARVVGLGNRSIDTLEAYFKGTDVDGEKVKIATQLVGHGVKVKHMEQTRDQHQISNAIRISRLIEDPTVRRKYMAATQPTVKGLLEDKRRGKKETG